MILDTLGVASPLPLCSLRFICCVLYGLHVAPSIIWFLVCWSYSGHAQTYSHGASRKIVLKQIWRSTCCQFESFFGRLPTQEGFVGVVNLNVFCFLPRRDSRMNNGEKLCCFKSTHCVWDWVSPLATPFLVSRLFSEFGLTIRGMMFSLEYLIRFWFSISILVSFHLTMLQNGQAKPQAVRLAAFVAIVRTLGFFYHPCHWQANISPHKSTFT